MKLSGGKIAKQNSGAISARNTDLFALLVVGGHWAAKFRTGNFFDRMGAGLCR
jgi:hypothetical protein